VRSIDEDDGEHYLHDLSYVAYAYIWLYQMLCDSEVKALCFKALATYYFHIIGSIAADATIDRTAAMQRSTTAVFIIPLKSARLCLVARKIHYTKRRFSVTLNL
jgi:hypothetical protein